MTDSHCVKGKGRSANADYVLSGMQPVPFLMVADGCSSIAHTDTGARLLAWALRARLHAFAGSADDRRVQTLVEQATTDALAVAKSLGMNRDALSATLLLGFVIDDRVTAVVCGDGVVAWENADGTRECAEWSYTHDAPYYPLYAVDAGAAQRYVQFSGAARKTQNRNGQVDERPLCEISVLSWPVQNIRKLLLASDGLQQFRQISTGEALPARHVAESLLQMQHAQGVFLQRRMRRVLKECDKNGVSPRDDVGVSAMVLV